MIQQLQQGIANGMARSSPSRRPTASCRFCSRPATLGSSSARSTARRAPKRFRGQCRRQLRRSRRDHVQGHRGARGPAERRADGAGTRPAPPRRLPRPSPPPPRRPATSRWSRPSTPMTMRASRSIRRPRLLTAHPEINVIASHMGTATQGATAAIKAKGPCRQGRLGRKWPRRRWRGGSRSDGTVYQLMMQDVCGAGSRSSMRSST